MNPQQFDMFNGLFPGSGTDEGAAADPYSAMFSSFMTGMWGIDQTSSNSTPNAASATSAMPAMPFMPAPPMPAMPAMRPVPAPRRVPAPAAAGSEAQLLTPSAPPSNTSEEEKFQELRHCALSARSEVEDEEPKRKKTKTDNIESVSNSTAKLKFQKFVESLEKKPAAAAAKPKKPEPEPAETNDDSDSTSDSGSENDSEDELMEKKKRRGGKGKLGRPTGKRMTAISKDELRGQVAKLKLQKKNLQKQVKQLEEENMQLKIKLKIKSQQEGGAGSNASSASDDVQIISSDDEHELGSQAGLRGLPMSFQWGPEDRTVNRVERTADPEQSEWEEDWESEEDNNFRVPDDDFGHLESYTAPKNLPFVKHDKNKPMEKLEEYLHPCRCCAVDESVNVIIECGHFGLCEECAERLEKQKVRCPGCGKTHIIKSTKMWKS